MVVNSGCANAITGTQGLAAATEMGLAADACFDSGASRRKPRDGGGLATSIDPVPETLVMSTGVIGQQLPIEKITEAIPKAHAALGSTHEHWMRAAQAICTTDTFPKLVSRTFTLPSHPQTEYRIAGMAKGAGMIHPNMGTLLSIICTDAKIDRSMVGALRASTGFSFNSISIDGDTSTNDTVALLANGAAAPEGAPSLQFLPKGQARWNDDAVAFYDALKALMTDLAQLVVRDGEGATKFVTIRVLSDVNKTTANRVAKSIATSNLVKTALYGRDANWGRILCAIGYTPGIIDDSHAGIGAQRFKDEQGVVRKVVQVGLDNTSLSFIPSDGSAELKLLTRGEPEEVDEARATEILEMEDLEILVRLEDRQPSLVEGAMTMSGQGQKTWESVFWTCDFSHEYVTINGDYRT